MAAAMYGVARARPNGPLLVPVGPGDQFPLLAEIVNREGTSLRNVVLINMDEYLTDDDAWLPAAPPLSFRGFMDRKFYDLLDPSLAPPAEHRVFPDPGDPSAIGRLIAARGGVHVCFGGGGREEPMPLNHPPVPGAGV